MQPVQNPIVPDFVHQLQRVDTYAEIEEIKKSPDFLNAGADERTIFLEDTMLMSEGQRHSEQKRLFAPLVSRQALAFYELKLVEPVIQETIAEMTSSRDADGLVRLDLVPLIHAALTRIAARITGVDGVDTPEETDLFRNLVLEISAATTASYSAASDPKGLIERGRYALQKLVDLFMKRSLDRRIELVRRHKAVEIGAEQLPRDMLTALCMADDIIHPDDAQKIPYVWRQCALFLTASIKTTSHSLPHAFLHIDEWIREHPEDMTNLTDPEWLHRATAESFRLHQTTPARFRRAAREVVLSTGRKVKAGEMVALHAPVANVSTEIFGDDARLFNPYRKIPEGMKPWGMTFGLGVHTCLGQNLVTGIQNKGDTKHGTHGTAVRLLKALYEFGAEVDTKKPAQRPDDNLHDTWDTVPVILRNA